ncbi:hypothetical protein [Streptomyces sp. AGS-58]|uniref:hypothetical protein n=1 Tax=unclassified Streptomyces TaxID=2593676 RepID=UPI0035A3BA44
MLDGRPVRLERRIDEAPRTHDGRTRHEPWGEPAVGRTAPTQLIDIADADPSPPYGLTR